MNITFLGTGTSHGVPSIDCMLDNYARCPKGVCRESARDPRHARSRCSILVEYNDRRVLVDVSPDFRQQALRERFGRIDAVLLTHKHADHIGGIPDLRSYSRLLDKPLDTYGSAETIAHIRTAYDYIFDPDTFVGGGITRLETTVVDGTFRLFDRDVTPVRVVHGTLAGCFGYRIGPMAYVPDMKEMPAASMAALSGVECLILNCLRGAREHSTHLILEQSMALARELAPRKCFFVHMCHDIHYRIDSERLDPWMSFAYDGLKISTS